MADLLAGSLTALWLGILTSVSPCPLATNIAAVSFIGRCLDRPRLVLLAGVLYTAGRAATYAILGTLLVESLLNAPFVSHLLQKYLNRLLGPLLVLVGMFLLDLLALPTTRGGGLQRFQERLSHGGIPGAFLLGSLFALSFCPISAALFFGSLVPLATAQDSGILLPFLYGVGTGIPVLAVSLVTALGIRSIGAVFRGMTTFEKWARPVTGIVFVLAGIYLSLVYVFGVLS